MPHHQVMAFFSVHNALVRDMWPNGLGRRLAEAKGLGVVPAWRILPIGFESLCDRVAVDGAATMSPRVLLSHPELDEQDKMVEMSVRLQGFVTDVNLGALGNWQLTPEHIPKAVQFLTLQGGGGACQLAFDAQRDGVDHLEAIVRTALSTSPVGQLARNNEINLRRRVFTRVRPGETAKAIKLPPREDPGGKAAKFHKDWVIDHRIRTAVPSSSDKFVSTNSLAIRKGDFVDVAATVSVIVKRGKYVNGTEVILCPTEVVRLWSAAESSALLRGPEVASEKHRSTAQVLDVETGFDIVDEEDEMQEVR